MKSLSNNVSRPVIATVRADETAPTSAACRKNALPKPVLARSPAEVADAGRIRMGAGFRLPTVRR